MEIFRKKRKKWLISTISYFVIFCFLYQNVTWAQGIGSEGIHALQQIKVENLPISQNGLASITIPENIGKIKEVWEGDLEKNERVIFHIQDSHANYEAQMNIAKILEHLLHNKDKSASPILICLEGAEGKVDVSKISKLPDTYNDVKKNITNYMAKSGLLTGVEYYAGMSPYDPNVVLWGVEESNAYLENVRLFKELHKDKDEVLRWIEQRKNELNRLSNKILTSEQNWFIKIREQYHNDDIGLEMYVEYLKSKAGNEICELNPDFNRLIELIDLKKRIDFSKIEEERMYLIKELKKILDKEELKELIILGLNYQIGKISAREYFSILEERIENMELKRRDRYKNWKYGDSKENYEYENLLAYIDYVKMESNINRDVLFEELKEVGDTLRIELFRTKEEKVYERLYYHLSIIKKFIQLKIYREDLKYYKENRELFKARDNNTVNRFLDLFEKFCNIGIKRDRILVENTIKKAEELNAYTTILITGGFHTAGITELFKDRDVSYMVISPRMLEKHDKSRYISLMLERDPLEKILAFNGTRIGLSITYADRPLSEYSKEAQEFADGAIFSQMLFANEFLERELPSGWIAKEGKRIRDEKGIAYVLDNGELFITSSDIDNLTGAEGSVPSVTGTLAGVNGAEVPVVTTHYKKGIDSLSSSEGHTKPEISTTNWAQGFLNQLRTVDFLPLILSITTEAFEIQLPPIIHLGVWLFYISLGVLLIAGIISSNSMKKIVVEKKTNRIVRRFSTSGNRVLTAKGLSVKDIKEKIKKGDFVEMSEDEYLAALDRSNCGIGITGGGDCAGIADFLSALKKNLDQNLYMVGVRYAGKGLSAPPEDFAKNLILVDDLAAEDFVGQSSTPFGSARVDPLRSAPENTRKNISDYGFFYGTGGNDHLSLLERIAKEFPKMVVVGTFKSIDGDGWIAGSPAQMIGFNSAVETYRKSIWDIAQSTNTHEQWTVIEVFGRKAGKLAFEAARRFPPEFSKLNTEERRKIEDCRDSLMILVPERPVSFKAIAEEARRIKEKEGSVVVVVAEGFMPPELQSEMNRLAKDKDLKEKWKNKHLSAMELFLPRVNHPDILRLIRDRELAEKFAKIVWESKLDEYGNVAKISGIRYFIIQALYKLAGADKVNECIENYEARGASPSEYDRVMGRKIGRKIAELINEGVVGGKAVVYFEGMDAMSDDPVVVDLEGVSDKNNLNNPELYTEDDLERNGVFGTTSSMNLGGRKLKQEEAEMDELIRGASQMPPYCPKIEEVGRDNLFIVVDGKYHLKAEDYQMLLSNLVLLKEFISSWKSVEKEKLIDYMVQNTKSGFIKLADISYDSGVLSVKIGNCASVAISTETLKVVSQSGLTFLPVETFYRTVARDEYNEILKDVDFDPEENMGLDVILSHEGVIANWIEEIGNIERQFFKLDTGSTDKSFEMKIEGLKDEEIERVTISVSEEKLLEKEFIALDNPGNIVNKLNMWYYQAFGGEAFGKIDKKGTLEESNARKSAKEFYGKLNILDKEGSLPEEIVVQEWGAGDGYSASVLLDMIQVLDQENNTNYYKKIKYILVDKSSKAIDDIKKSSYLLKHKKLILPVVMDVLDPEGKLPKALLIRANLLLNSLPKKMVRITGGKVYELYTRAYLDIEEGKKLLDSSGKEYGIEDIRHIISEEDIGTMSNLGKEFFDRIKWEEKYTLIENIRKYSYGEYLGKLAAEGFQGEVTLDIGALRCIKNMVENLSLNGNIQICEAGTTKYSELEYIAGRLFRFHGAIYSPVNFNFLNYMLPISVKAVNQVIYGGEHVRKRIRLVKVLNIVCRDFKSFKKYFNFETFMKLSKGGRKVEVLQSTSQELMDRYGGLTNEGLKEFKIKLSDSVQSLSKRAMDEIASPFEETIAQADNYADAYIYWVYRKIQKERDNLLNRQKWLIPGSWQRLSEDNEHNAFVQFCSIYMFKDAIDAIFNDMARFYPGLMVFDINSAAQSINAKKVLVNGVGLIGSKLAVELKEIGFDVYVSDTVRAKVDELVNLYDCKPTDARDLQKMKEGRFDLIIDTSTAGEGEKNKKNIYDKLSYKPKVLFNGGEESDIAFRFVSSSDLKEFSRFYEEHELKIESCNFSAMAILFIHILQNYEVVKIVNYYQKSGDTIENYVPYHHNLFKSLIERLDDKASKNLSSFQSFIKGTDMPDYHIHRAKISATGLNAEEVKKLIKESANSYRILLIDEKETKKIKFEDLIRNIPDVLRDIPVVIARFSAGEADELMIIEYAVPFAANVIPDNISAVFISLGLDGNLTSSVLKRYTNKINGQKNKLADFITRHTYLHNYRNISGTLQSGFPGGIIGTPFYTKRKDTAVGGDNLNREAILDIYDSYGNGIAVEIPQGKEEDLSKMPYEYCVVPMVVPGDSIPEDLNKDISLGKTTEKEITELVIGYLMSIFNDSAVPTIDKQTRSYKIGDRGIALFDISSAIAILTENGDLLIQTHFWIKYDEDAMESWSKEIKEALPEVKLTPKPRWYENADISSSQKTMDFFSENAWRFFEEFSEDNFAQAGLLMQIIEKIDISVVVPYEKIKYDENLGVFISEKDKDAEIPGFGENLEEFLASLNTIQQLSQLLYLLVVPKYKMVTGSGQPVQDDGLQYAVIGFYYRVYKYFDELAVDYFNDPAIFEPLRMEVGRFAGSLNKAIRIGAVEINGANPEDLLKMFENKNIGLSDAEKRRLFGLSKIHGGIWAYDILQLQEVLSEENFIKAFRYIKVDNPRKVLPSDKPYEIFDGTGRIGRMGLALRLAGDVNAEEENYYGRYMVRTRKIPGETTENKLNAARQILKEMFSDSVIEASGLELKVGDGAMEPISDLIKSGRFAFEFVEEALKAKQDFKIENPIESVYPIIIKLDGKPIGTVYFVDIRKFTEGIAAVLGVKQKNTPRPFIVEEEDGRDIYFGMMTDATPGGVEMGDGVMEEADTSKFTPPTVWQMIGTDKLKSANANLGGAKEELIRLREILDKFETDRLNSKELPFEYLKAQITKKLLLPLGGGVHFMGRYIHKLPKVKEYGASYYTPTSCSTNGASYFGLMLSTLFGFGTKRLSLEGTTFHMYTGGDKKGIFGHLNPKSTGAAKGVKQHFVIDALFTAARTPTALKNDEFDIVGGSVFDFLVQLPYEIPRDVLVKYLERVGEEYPEILKVFGEMDKVSGRYLWKDTIGGQRTGSIVYRDLVEQIAQITFRAPVAYDNEMSYSFQMNATAEARFLVGKRQRDRLLRKIDEYMENTLAKKDGYLIRDLRKESDEERILKERVEFIKKHYEEFKKDFPKISLYQLWKFYLPMMEWEVEKIKDNVEGSHVLGVVGGQGSGKTTLAEILKFLLKKKGYKTINFSIDDIYKTYEDRKALKEEIPELDYRGPPGTHDVDLGIAVILSIKYANKSEEEIKGILEERGCPEDLTKRVLEWIAKVRSDGLVRTPVFNKGLEGSKGEREKEDKWKSVEEPDNVKVIIFEGWCLGAVPIKRKLLKEPIAISETLSKVLRLNKKQRRELIDYFKKVETDKDPKASIREKVNQELSGDYRFLWNMLDDLVFLNVVDIKNTIKWRQEQELDIEEDETTSRKSPEDIKDFVDKFNMLYLRFVLPQLETNKVSLVLDIGEGHIVTGYKEKLKKKDDSAKAESDGHIMGGYTPQEAKAKLAELVKQRKAKIFEREKFIKRYRERLREEVLVNLPEYIVLYNASDTIVDEEGKYIFDMNTREGKVLYLAEDLISVLMYFDDQLSLEFLNDYTYHAIKCRGANHSKVMIAQKMLFGENYEWNEEIGKYFNVTKEEFEQNIRKGWLRYVLKGYIDGNFRDKMYSLERREDSITRIQEAFRQRRENISTANSFRKIGFDGEKSRLDWVGDAAWSDVDKQIALWDIVLSAKENVIFIGMGGSINTIKALIRLYGLKNVFAIDSLDSKAIDNISSQIGDNWHKTLVVPITKSATTGETHTLANTLIEIFDNRKLDYKNHFAWMADRSEDMYSKKKLGKYGVDWEGSLAFSIQPDDMTDTGGRFSAPFTMIYLLPLYLAVGRDSERLKEEYSKLSGKLDMLRKDAVRVARTLHESGSQYFAVRTPQNGALETWIIQLFQESLGSKIRGFNPKTIVVGENEEIPQIFSPIDVPKGETPAGAMALSAYYLQFIVAAIAYYKGINFVTQPSVELYKRKAKELEGKRLHSIRTIDLVTLINQIRESLRPEQKFIELVVYAHRDEEELEMLKGEITKAFPEKVVLVFEGSDWNHHSYQATEGNKDTLFGIITAHEYGDTVQGIRKKTLRDNAKQLRRLAYATYETIAGKAILARMNLNEFGKNAPGEASVAMTGLMAMLSAGVLIVSGFTSELLEMSSFVGVIFAVTEVRIEKAHLLEPTIFGIIGVLAVANKSLYYFFMEFLSGFFEGIVEFGVPLLAIGLLVRYLCKNREKRDVKREAKQEKKYIKKLVVSALVALGSLLTPTIVYGMDFSAFIGADISLFLSNLLVLGIVGYLVYKYFGVFENKIEKEVQKWIKEYKPISEIDEAEWIRALYFVATARLHTDAFGKNGWMGLRITENMINRVENNLNKLGTPTIYGSMNGWDKSTLEYIVKLLEQKHYGKVIDVKIAYIGKMLAENMEPDVLNELKIRIGTYETGALGLNLLFKGNESILSNIEEKLNVEKTGYMRKRIVSIVSKVVLPMVIAAVFIGYTTDEDIITKQYIYEMTTATQTELTEEWKKEAIAESGKGIAIEGASGYFGIVNIIKQGLINQYNKGENVKVYFSDISSEADLISFVGRLNTANIFRLFREKYVKERIGDIILMEKSMQEKEIESIADENARILAEFYRAGINSKEMTERDYGLLVGALVSLYGKLVERRKGMDVFIYGSAALREELPLETIESMRSILLQFEKEKGRSKVMPLFVETEENSYLDVKALLKDLTVKDEDIDRYIVRYSVWKNDGMVNAIDEKINALIKNDGIAIENTYILTTETNRQIWDGLVNIVAVMTVESGKFILADYNKALLKEFIEVSKHAIGYRDMERIIRERLRKDMKEEEIDMLFNGKEDPRILPADNKEAVEGIDKGYKGIVDQL